MLLKVLDEAHVTSDITTEKFAGIVGNIAAHNYLTFTDEEVAPEGRSHNKALHITVKCMDFILARVLIDNGSSLNVHPKMTLDRLPCDQAAIKPTSMVVRAFDGSRRMVMGEIKLPIQIGPCTFPVLFQVMDITPTYSCLLGRPWIHAAGAVPSSLHQKLKFVFDNKQIIVHGKENVLVSCRISTLYIEAVEEALEIAFQALEVVETACIESNPAPPHLSKASLMVAKIMLTHGYVPGEGLGKGGKGRVRELEPVKNPGRYGLGYRPTKSDKGKATPGGGQEGGTWRHDLGDKRSPIPDIRESFCRAGWVTDEQIAVTGEEGIMDQSKWVLPCLQGFELSNWEVSEQAPIFAGKM